MKRPFYTAKVKNASVPVWRCKSKKYTYYAVADYSTGRRKVWTTSDPKKAKDKAIAIATALATGEQPLILKPRERACIQAALDLLPAEEVLIACKACLDTRPGIFTPTPLKSAVDSFLAAREGKVSTRRQMSDAAILGHLVKAFPGR